MALGMSSETQVRICIRLAISKESGLWSGDIFYFPVDFLECSVCGERMGSEPPPSSFRFSSVTILTCILEMREGISFSLGSEEGAGSE